MNLKPSSTIILLRAWALTNINTVGWNYPYGIKYKGTEYETDGRWDNIGYEVDEDMKKWEKVKNN